VSAPLAGEAELRNSEKQYRLLFQSKPQPMGVRPGTRRFWSPTKRHPAATAIRAKSFCDDRIPVSRQRSPAPAAIDVADAASSGGIGARTEVLWTWKLIWSPMAFRNRFAALTMATDVTKRRSGGTSECGVHQAQPSFKFGHHCTRSGDHHL